MVPNSDLFEGYFLATLEGVPAIGASLEGDFLVGVRDFRGVPFFVEPGDIAACPTTPLLRTIKIKWQ